MTHDPKTCKQVESDAALIASLNRYIEALEERIDELERLCVEHLEYITELKKHLSGITPHKEIPA